MKKFKYRLQALLKVKEHLEKERQKEHAAVVRKVINQEEALSQIDRDKDGTLSQQRERLTGSLSIAEMLIYARHILKLKRNILVEGELLNVLRKDEDKKRGALLRASKERKIYQKLKERQQERYNQDVESQTNKENDEVALNSFRLKER